MSGVNNVTVVLSPGALDVLDFSALPLNTVAFGANVTTQSLTFSVNGDADFEADESFSVILQDPTNGVVLGVASATATIPNDEPFPLLVNFTPTTISTYGGDQDAGLVLVSNDGSEIRLRTTPGSSWRSMRR